MCEAMAAVLPVVASPVGSIPEIVRNGIERILARAVSPSRLRDAVVRIVSDRKKFTAIGESAADRIQHVCDVKTICAQELGLLEIAEVSPSS